MWNDFKNFAMRGNVLDLAVGVIIGAAFGKIVSSLVDDVIMPLFGLLLGGIHFKNLSFTFNDTKIMYGSFIQSIVDFLIIAFSIFIFIRFVNRFKKQEEKKAEISEVDSKEKLLTEIRDLLKEK
ncbi:large conductance mechanosensitive channel protein MscL [Bacillus aquiflavi]|uniref:Large-conductance mechanosensitive channel n=1 Tax=Bacillus aquiflavi TaxID=2672567 RepID=A0A6B3VUZ8_9BACI|nr:large conductance mechanosensitive channel protein MscL [Bacillus aquiflavi]MBA4536721.1 large conductance mechanosensitive channel protein MscL [Bacillus aquiflavi]NEY81088.1 large conductance mechanosensitive channel protein MscL [Bacillus aquiflavi]UAC48754.1 large conductance mechanosensitive channel protein MscL [Bacillus aquiflavi]